MTLLTAVAAFAPIASAGGVTIEPLGSTEDRFTPWSINNNGVVAGEKDIDLITTAHRWSPGVGLEEIGTLGFAQSIAWGVNDDGKMAITGYETTDDFNPVGALRVSKSEGVLDAGFLDQDPTQVRGINNKGDLVGFSTRMTGPDAFPRAYIYTDEGGMQDLGLLGGNRSRAIAVGDSRVVTGWSEFGDGSTGEVHAFWVEPGGEMIDIGTLYGGSSLGLGVNSDGVVVGESVTGFLDTSAFIFDPAIGVIEPIDDPMSPFSSRAEAISDSGEVVGNLFTGFTSAGAFYWTREGGMINLNEFLPEGSNWVIESALDMNDNGQIIGLGRLDGAPVGFVMTIPAPTGSLVVLTAATLLHARRRR